MLQGMRTHCILGTFFTCSISPPCPCGINWMGDLVPCGASVKASWPAESHRYVYIFDSKLYAWFCTSSVPACQILPKHCHLVSQNLAQPLHLYVIRCAAMAVCFNWRDDLVPFGTSVKTLWVAASHRCIYIFDSIQLHLRYSSWRALLSRRSFFLCCRECAPIVY